MMKQVKNGAWWFDSGVLADRQAITEGYMWKCRGNGRFNGDTDHWSGMPDADYDVFYFNNEAEAREFAIQEKCPYGGNMEGTLCKLEWGTTYAEKKAEDEHKLAERRTRKEVKDKATAEQMGLTYEDYITYQKLTQQIKGCGTRVENLRAKIAEIEGEIAEIETEARKKQEKADKIWKRA